jgi:hypothetical protein
MESETKPNEPHPAETQGITRTWSPFLRLGMLVLFGLTLPFTWGESSSCNGPTRTFTGLEQITKNPGNAISLIVLLVTPVLLAFCLHLARAAWVRLGFECIAGMFSNLALFFCFLSAVFSGDLLHKSSRVYPAPWMATLATLVLTLDAYWGAFLQIKQMVQARRRAKNEQVRARGEGSSPPGPVSPT